ncbi:uncharacterized protein EV420DRAFT_882849 [Desarmillaria tabescens]|uniref:F-box domain-containing protein n=1 Tax=Armillaria tabescens TaxID=1929756 RepID=A0AA39JR25_ARMTA|nr:uncharacterized protein EV420DRAFT_882849 [Desarmillaria tabescens]KAK0446952.1 hypothetical protein EV420DRAFT_882849 [Desarmillaria tabescens]
MLDLSNWFSAFCEKQVLDDQGPSDSAVEMGLQTLPYDLLLNIAAYLSLYDVHALHLTCKSLYDFSITRPVYRQLATDLLKRCRALPLKGFQRPMELTTPQLIRAVNKATRNEHAWRRRTPRPITRHYEPGIHPLSNYLDSDENIYDPRPPSWYRIVRSPPEEEVDWLSPITSSYTLCATKSGKVVCWDIQTDTCLAEWTPGEKWELWKCRVEFETRSVYFTMAKVPSGSYDDAQIMEFILMRLRFPEPLANGALNGPPTFNHVTRFKTKGVVMNVFLLDPVARLLSSYIWISTSNTIALYLLPDWSKDEYVFIDTGIECSVSSNWSCILLDKIIVVHCEEHESLSQYFYPVALLMAHIRPAAKAPTISGHVPPFRSLSKKFIFPPPIPFPPPNGDNTTPTVLGISAPGAAPASLLALSTNGTASTATNPFPFPPWYPESAHFVRQWWPALHGMPRVSCTVILMASHDPITHKTRFILAQHYFRVPMLDVDPDWLHFPSKLPYSSSSSSTKFPDTHLMKLWYVSTPFEIVCVLDGPEPEPDEESDRPRPLIAVDFGHAVWIEYVEVDGDSGVGDPEAKWLRFVTFPPYDEDGSQCGGFASPSEVRTLEIPEELDLDTVETINIDQSQGAVILSVKEGKIFILCYE